MRKTIMTDLTGKGPGGIVTGVLFGLLSSLAVLTAEAAQPSTVGSDQFCEPPAVVNRSAESVIRVGYTPFGLMADERLMLRSLKATLTAEKLGHPVIFREYSASDLKKAIEDGRVDIVFSESPFYQALIEAGLRSVTTIVCDVQPDPNQNDGTAVIVGRDSAYRTFADLRGTRLVAASPESFSGYLYAVRELIRRKLGEPAAFFSSQDFVDRHDKGDGNAAVFDAVMSGKADVGFLPLCALEQLAKTDPSVHSRVRVIEERFTDAVTDCRHSTPLYPALTLSVTPRISASVSKAVTMDLLMLPKGESGFMWSVASDFQNANALLRDLQIGPYEYLKQTGLRRIWRDYRTEILCGLVLLLALIAHGIRSQVLVRRRENELRAAAREQFAQCQKLERLQKAGVVGQISGLVAHELRQPLSAISLYAEGLEDMVKNNAISREEMLDILHSMTADAARASEIVERVRQYAKKKADVKPVSVREAFAKADQTVSHFAVGSVPTVIGDFPDAVVLINPLDLELVFGNMLKNAKEAASSQSVEPAEVRVSAAAEDGFVTVSIEDNGPELTEAAFDQLNEPVSSRKPDGLGLGLSIARNIVENVGGSIHFERRSTGCGLVTRVRLPISAAAEEVS